VVSHIKGVREQGVKENIWTQEEGTNRRLKLTASRGASSY